MKIESTPMPLARKLVAFEVMKTDKKMLSGENSKFLKHRVSGDFITDSYQTRENE